jgi:hypothetical protein
MDRMARKPPPKKKPTAEPAAARLRGASLVDAVIAALAPSVASPAPLGEDELRALEARAGVSLGPWFRRFLAFDGSWLSKQLRWDLRAGLPVKSCREVIAAHAGPFIEAYDLVLPRLPGKALGLDEGSDSMRFLYFEPGAAEPPVLYIDHDDTPVIGVAYPGFDVWIAHETGLLPFTSRAGAEDARAISERLFGDAEGIDTTHLMAAAYGGDD